MPVRISSNLDTKNSADRYATHLGNLTKGGVHTKDSIAQMNAIPFERRTRMMLCVVADGGSGVQKLYWLNTPPNPTNAQLADNNYWEEVPLGTTINGVLTLQGFEDATALTILDGIGNTGDTYIAEVGGAVNNPNIFNGQAVNINVGDYLVYEAGTWHVVPTGATAINWDTLTGKPSAFNPEAHQHIIADITDFPDLSRYLTQDDVETEILESSNGTDITSVDAVKNYVTQRIDSIEGYILYVSSTLAQLTIDIPSPTEGNFAYIQSEYAMYRYLSGAWVKQYDTSLDSNDEALGTFKDLNIVGHGFAVNDVLARSGANYTKSIDDTLPPVGIVVQVSDVDNFKLWTGGFTNLFVGLTPDSKYFINASGELSTIDNGRLIMQSVSTSEAYLFNSAGSTGEAAVIVTETFTYVSGTPAFTLSNSPVGGIFLVTLKGIALTPVSDYTIVSETVTLLDTLIAGDEVTITYYYNLKQLGSFYLKSESDSRYSFKIVSVNVNAADYNANGNEFILVTAGALDRTITLPPAADNLDAVVEIKKVDDSEGNVIIDGNSTETIDGQQTLTIATQYTCLSMQSNGTEWFLK